LRQIPRPEAIDGVKQESPLGWADPSTLRPIRYRRFSQTWGCYPINPYGKYRFEVEEGLSRFRLRPFRQPAEHPSR
jgi:hypothetical protein